jgi:hypothetical protein
VQKRLQWKSFLPDVSRQKDWNEKRGFVAAAGKTKFAQMRGMLLLA